jgi:hypothetical protein
VTGPETDASNPYVMLVCMAAVTLYAYNRYDTPGTNRLSTTWSLFVLTGICYIISTLAIFFVLSEVVLKPGVLPFLGLEDAQKLVSQFTAPPVLAAVVLTTLLPNTPVVSAADKALLQAFQSWGRIPNGVRHLADRMPQIALCVQENDIATLRDWISHDSDVPNELIDYLGPELKTPSGWLTRVMRLYKEAEILKLTPTYAAAFRSQREVWQAIHEDFRVFTGQSQAFFVLFDRLKPLAGEAGQNALKQAESSYQGTCAKLYDRVTQFLAQMLIMTEPSQGMVDNRLRHIGYDISQELDDPLPIGPFAFMGVILMIVILGVMATVPLPPRPESALPLAVTAVLIAATKTIGAAVAVLPKLRWSVFRRGDKGPHPYLAWIASAIAAAATSLIFKRLAMAVAHGTIAAASDFRTYPLTPLAPTSFMICLAIAILCDEDFRLGKGIGRRYKEGLICGAAMVIAVFICVRLLSIQSATAAQTTNWFPYAFSFFLGTAAGFFAPYLYREARGEEAKTLAPIAEPLPPGVGSLIQ